MKTRILTTASGIAHIIKSSLAMAIPILFLGSFTVLLNGFPIQAYQDFMDSFLGGALRGITLIIQYTTLGILAIHITIAINFSYISARGEDPKPTSRLASLLCCLIGFFILVGFFSGEPQFSLFSGQGVFSALLAGLIGSALFRRFEQHFKSRRMIFVDGADSEFNATLQIILPFLAVILCFAAANYLITICFDVPSVQHLFMKVMDAIFLRMHRSYSSGLLFTTLISTMWWFGIHGNNVLNQVAIDMFTEIIPGEIVSKSFIDTFVNMGGTGCTIGLLVAMMVFGKRSSTKKLSGMALFPGIFNIGELLVFGFPVIYNPVMALPFILSPMLCFTNAYLLTKTGFVPPVTTEVVWTTPALLSGYLATGSVRGILVQLFNILLSTACYAPFVIRYEKKSLHEYASSMTELVETLKNSEDNMESIILTESRGNAGKLAKLLAADLEAALSASAPGADPAAIENPLFIHYQPQFDREGTCIGAEAFLRWSHKRYGVIYPPLVIQIAAESRELYKLETFIIERAIRDAESFRQRFGEQFMLSINVTAATIHDKKLLPFLQTMADRYRLRSGNICLEIAEKAELVTTERTAELIGQIRMFGYTFALDNFGLGHISLQYLQRNPFDIVKLDGRLIRTDAENEHTYAVIRSILDTSESQGFKVIATFVETQQQKEILEKLGCTAAQGYLFSPAVDKESLTNK